MCRRAQVIGSHSVIHSILFPVYASNIRVVSIRIASSAKSESIARTLQGKDYRALVTDRQTTVNSDYDCGIGHVSI
jgi:hypothetical protein